MLTYVHGMGDCHEIQTQVHASREVAGRWNNGFRIPPSTADFQSTAGTSLPCLQVPVALWSASAEAVSNAQQPRRRQRPFNLPSDLYRLHRLRPETN
jgi:hypothetical protein